MPRILIFSLLLLVSTAGASEDDRAVSNPELARVADGIAGFLRVHPAARLGIVPLADGAGRPLDAGLWLGDMLTAAVAERVGDAAGCLIERDLRDAMWKEIKEQMSDLYDPQTAVRLGRLAGATHLLIGRLHPVADQGQLAMRIVNVETGEVETGFAATIPGRDIPGGLPRLEPRDDPLQVAWGITGREDPGEPEGRRRPIRAGDALSSGDGFRVSFRLSRNAYVYLLLFDSQGEVSCLFPGFGIEESNWVLGNRSYHIPPGRGWYGLDEHPGEETVFLVASADPVPAMDELLASLGGSVRPGEEEGQATPLERFRNGTVQILKRGVSGVIFGDDDEGEGDGETTIDTFNEVRPNEDPASALNEVLIGRGFVVRSLKFRHLD